MFFNDVVLRPFKRADGGTLARLQGADEADVNRWLGQPNLTPVRDCLIAEVGGLAIVRGYRGLPEGDVAALADALVRLSALAILERPVREAEINPLIVKAAGAGVAAVDGFVALGDGDPE